MNRVRKIPLYIFLIFVSVAARATEYPEFLPQNINKRLVPYLEESKQYFGIDDKTLKITKQDSNKSRLLVFISSSMPENMLKQYALDARRFGGVLVLRGFIEGDLTKTISFIKSLNKGGVEAIISPHGFRQMDVRHVPTIAVISASTECYLSDCERTPLYDKISGSVTLKYALEEISNSGENSREEALLFLNKGGDV